MFFQRQHLTAAKRETKQNSIEDKWIEEVKELVYNTLWGD
jgi:hypothetical protein